jgi:hypothetical protein
MLQKSGPIAASTGGPASGVAAGGLLVDDEQATNAKSAKRADPHARV